MIEISISGKDFNLTPALKDYVSAKLARLARYNKQIQRIGVELDVDRNHQSGDVFRVEVWVYLPSQTIQAGQKADDMLAALDRVYPKLERQLVRTKEKRRSIRRHQSRRG